MLTIEDVARYLGVKPRTLTQYRSDSKHGRRFANNPFPEPLHSGRSVFWEESQLSEIDSWIARRPGQGIGGGRPLNS